jgi:hypothetical protein
MLARPQNIIRREQRADNSISVGITRALFAIFIVLSVDFISCVSRPVAGRRGKRAVYIKLDINIFERVCAESALSLSGRNCQMQTPAAAAALRHFFLRPVPQNISGLPRAR